MATNNGTRLEVFGLSFREHHTLHMQQILRQYHKLPAASSGPPNRAALFAGLFDLAKEVNDDQAQRIKDWLKNGGEFPAPVIAPVTVAAELMFTTDVERVMGNPHENNDETLSENEEKIGDPMDEGSNEVGDGEGDWPQYNPDDYRDIGKVDHAEEEPKPEDEGISPATDHLSTPQAEPLNPDIRDGQGNDDPGHAVGEEIPRPNRGRGGGPGRTLSGSIPAFNQAGDIHPGTRQRGRGQGYYGRGRGVGRFSGFGRGFGPGRTLSGAAPVNMDEGLTRRTRNGSSLRGGHALSDVPVPYLDDDENDDENDDELPAEYGARYPGAYQGRGHTLSGIAPPNPSVAPPWGSSQRGQPRRHTLTDFSPVHEDENHEGDLEVGLNNRSPTSTHTHRDYDEHAGTSSDEPKDPNSDPTDIECGICAESLPASAFPPSKKITKNCEDHLSQACYPCIERSIQSTLDEGSIHRLICLFCHEKMSHEEVKNYASKSAFARYEYLLLLDSPDIVMCLSPICNAGQKHTDKDNPKMVCNTCSYETCVLHKLPWHSGITCAEFDISEAQIDRLDAAEATAKLLAKEHSKICPNCHQGVSRTEGCDHLLCRCGKEWCFLCLASWENIMRIGPTAHAVTCDNHPHKVRATAAQVERNRNALSALAFGGLASVELLAARDKRNARIIADARGRSLAAAERRLKEQKECDGREGREGRDGERVAGEVRTRKRKVNLKPAWEEGGLTKKSF